MVLRAVAARFERSHCNGQLALPLNARTALDFVVRAET